MRNVFSAKLAALSMLAPAMMFGQLSISNYQLVSTVGTNQTYTAQVTNTGVAVGSVTATASGTNPFAFRVEPGAGTLNFGPVASNGTATSTNSFTIIVSAAGPVNWANLQWSFQTTPAGPVANAGPNQTAALKQTVTLDGSGSTNPSGVGTLSYQWAFVTRPAGSSTILTNQSGIHPTFFVDVAGTYVVQLTVSNGSISSSATVIINTGDTAPVANAGPNQSAIPGTTITLNGSGSTDANSDPLTYLWTLTTIPAGSAATLSSTTAVKPTFVADLAGTYVATLVVNDGTLNSAPSTVTISDTTPPVANAGPNQVVNAETTVHLDASGSTDVDGKQLTYLWSLITKPANSTATLNSTTAVQPTFVADLPNSTYIAQLIVSDGGIPSAPATVTITTNPPLPPTANAGPDQTLQNLGIVQLSGSGTDPQNFQLTYLWSFTSKPANSQATLTGATTATPKFLADVPGTYVVQLIVNDGFLPSAPATVTITTSPGSPTANPGSPATVTVGTTVTLSGSGSLDPNGEPLTYSWTFNSKPAGSTATLTGANTASPTFVPDVAGLYVAQLIVSDGFASSTPVTVNITASVVTTPAIILQNGIVVSAGGQATLSITLSAPSASSLFVTLASDSANVTFTPSNGVVVFPANSTGPLTLKVNGVNFGMANITAKAGTYTNGTTSVLVSDTITLTPAGGLTITGEKTQQSYVTLSGTASTGGVTINLTSSNTSVATVPASVIIPAGQTVMNFPVTSVGGGTAVIHASNALLGIADTTLNVTVVALEITTTQLNPGIQGGAYSQTLTATNGTTPYTWALTSGTLPTGMTFSPAGVLSGTPTVITAQSGVPLTFRVTDSSSPVQFATVTLTLTVTAGIPNSITPNAGTTPQSAGDTTVFSTPLSVTVEDVNSVPVPNAKVTFTIVPGAGGAGATFAGAASTAQVQTNSSGVATAPALTANSVLGAFTVQAMVSPVQNPATFNLTNIVGAPATMTVTSGSNQSAVEGTPFANPLVVTVKDAGGFVVPGAVVTFAAPLSVNGTFSGGNTATTTASGVATSNQFVAGSKAGAYVVTATSGAANTTFSLTNNVGAPATITVSSGSNQSVAVNTAFATQLVATVKDSGGNALPGVAVTFTAVPGPSGQSATFTTSNTVNTDASGNATVSVKANGIVGTASYSVTANTSPALSSPATFQLSNLTGPPNSIAVVNGSGQSTGITTAFAQQLVAVVKDSGGNLVSGASVTFSVLPGTGPSVTFPNGPTVATDVNGDASIAVKANTVTGGPYTVTATTAIGGLTTTFSLTNLVGPASAVAVSSGSGQSIGINSPFASLVAKVTDAGGNAVPNATVLFTAPPTSASGTFAGAGTTTTAVTGSNGLATAPAFTANSVISPGGVAYNVTATVTGVAAGANFSLVNLAGSPAQIVINGGNGQGVQTGKAYASLSVIVKDSAGDTLPNVGVTFQAPGTGASVTFANNTNLTTATTGATGIATSSAVTANGTFGQVVITAFVTQTPAISTTFTLNNNAGPPASIAVNAGSAQTATVLAPYSQLQAIVKDSSGNNVVGASVTFTAVTGPGGATGTFAGGAVTTNGSGIATSTVLTANKTAGNFTVTASVTGVSQPASFALTNVASAPASITATSGTQQTTPIGTAFAALVATVKDAGGNLVSGANVTFTAPPSGPSGLFAGAATTTAVTGTTGQATAPTFTANSTASPNTTTFYNVVASVNGVSANFMLTNGPGQPATITPSTATNNQTAQLGTAYKPLSVTVLDPFGNAVAAGTVVTFTVVPGSGNAGATPSSMTAPTNAAGVATATSAFTANLFLGTFTVTATAGTTAKGTFTLQNIPGPPATITNNTGTGTQSAQINQQFATPLSVTVLDNRSHPVANTVQVTFTVVPAGGASGTYAGASSTTVKVDSNGMATAVLTANSVVGTYSAKATVVGTPGLTASFTMKNTVGPPAQIVITNGSGQSAVVGNNFTQAMVVTVQDAGGNAEPAGIGVMFAAPTGAGATGTFGAGATTTLSVTTSATGTATVAANGFKANTVSGTYNLTVTAATGTAPPLAFPLTNNPGAAASISVTSGSNQSAQLTQAFAAPFVATVYDSFKNLANATVVFSAPTGNVASGTFGTGTQTTASIATTAGVATSPAFTANKVMSAVGTSYNVTASVSGVSPSATFALTNLAGTPSTITLTTPTQSLQVNQTVTLTATVKDVGSDPLQGVVVTFTAPTGSGAGGTFTNGVNTATTNASGVATVSYTTNHVASTAAYNVGVSVPNNTAPAVNFSLTNTPGAPALVSPTGGSNQTVQINSLFTTPLVATVTDQYGNTVLAGISVLFTAPAQTGASGLFNGQATAIVPTTANGTVTVTTFKANAKVGSFAVTAAVTGATSASFAMAITPGNPATIALTSGNNQTAVVNTAFGAPFVVTVTDAGNNPVPGAVVTFTAPPATTQSGTFGGSLTTTATTSSSGVATAPVFTANTHTSPSGSTYSVTATTTPGTASGSFSLTNIAGVPASISVYQPTSPEATQANEQFNSPLEVLVHDQFSNLVSGAKVLFTAPSQSGASATFAGGNNTATTGTGSQTGIAVSNLISANGNVGPYSVTATIVGVSGPSASFALTNSVNNSSNGSFTMTPSSTSSLQVGQNMEIVVNVNLSNFVSCSTNPQGQSINVTTDGVNLLVGRGSVPGTSTTAVSIPCSTAQSPITQTQIYVQALSNLGSFPITLEAPGFTTNNSTMVTVTRSGFILSSTASQPFGTTLSTFQGLTSPALTVYAVQLDSSNNFVGLATVAGWLTGANALSIPVTVLDPTFGTMTTTPVTFQPGTGSALTSFVSSGKTGSTNLSITNTSITPVGFSQPNANTSVTVTVASSSIFPPTATVGLNLEAPVQILLNGQAPGPCGGQLSTPFTVASQNANLLFSLTATGAGLNTISVPIQNCGSSSQFFYAQVVGGSAAAALNFTVSGGGFPLANGTITSANSGFVIADSGNNPGTPSFFRTVANSGFPETLTVHAYSLDANKNPQTEQALAPGSSPSGTSVSIPVTVDNTQFGNVSPLSVTINSGTSSGTTVFTAVQGGTAGSPDIVMVSVTQPSLPAGFIVPAADTSIQGQITAPGILVSDTGSVGQYLQASGHIAIGTKQSSDLTFTLQVTSGSILLSNTGLDGGSPNIQLTIPAGQTSSPNYSIYGLDSSGSASYSATVNAPNAGAFNPGSSTVNLVPSGAAVVGNFLSGQELITSITQPLASGTYQGGLTVTGTPGEYCIINTFNGGGTGASANLVLAGSTVLSGTYQGGLTVTGAPGQTCALTGFADPTGTGATAFVTLTGSTVLSGTYVSGITAKGALGQTCMVSFIDATGTGATAILTLTGTDTIAGGSVLSNIVAGSGFSAAPTSASVIAGGNAICTGTAVVTTTVSSSIPIGTPLMMSTAGSGFTGAPTSAAVGTTGNATCSGTAIISTVVSSPLAIGTPLTNVSGGSLFGTAPTTAAAAGGTAICSGTATVATTLVIPTPFTVQVGELSNTGAWLNNQQALIPELNGQPFSVVINLTEPTNLGTFATNQVTLLGGQASAQVGFTPTIDGPPGTVTINSVIGLTNSGISSQSSMTVVVKN